MTHNLSQPAHPQLRLDVYPTTLLLSRWQEDGRCATYPVSAHDLVATCSGLGLSSGLLPANTLFYQQQAGQVRLAVYVPPRRWRVQTEARGYLLPMPALFFLGSGHSYRLFALKGRPNDEQAPLYHAPCPNVYLDGTVCAGETPFPVCSPTTIAEALTLVMERSLFNGDLSSGKCRSYPDDARQLWAVLDGQKRFPLRELMPANRTLAALL